MESFTSTVSVYNTGNHSKLTDALDEIPEREVVLHAVLHASNADAHEAVILGAKRRLSCRHCHD